MKSLFVMVLVAVSLRAERPTLKLSGSGAEAVTDLLGGSFVDFHLKSKPLNPLGWANRGPDDEARPMSHFLCLDRWGQPTDAELKNGMPFHGEATRVRWSVTKSTDAYALLEADLPIAKLHVYRTLRLGSGGAILDVSESVMNRNPLSRPYNMVQHPTIGPPFLDESVVVDSNARRGFMQSSPMPRPEDPMVVWPQALKDGMPVDLRHLITDPMPNVVSFVVEDARGWVTASNPAKGLLLGYTWLTAEYPWLNIWRHVQDGHPLARGLEFGTTGLHQPFPVLAKKGTIFGRPLFAYLDAGETQGRGYTAFLAEIPKDYKGVERLTFEAKGKDVKITLRERDSRPDRDIAVSAVLP